MPASIPPAASPRLRQAIESGMVVLIDDTHAAIAAPPNMDDLTDGDWLNILQAASGLLTELQSLGYIVKP